MREIHGLRENFEYCERERNYASSERENSCNQRDKQKFLEFGGEKLMKNLRKEKLKH